MAPPSKKSKVVNKDDLRKLMKEHKTIGSVNKKRIESPLAKYNTLGQLVCVVCNSNVKNEKLWNAHLLSRTHKENVVSLKESQQAAVRQQQHVLADTGFRPEKPNKSGLPEDFFDKPQKAPKQPGKSILKNAPPPPTPKTEPPTTITPSHTTESSTKADLPPVSTENVPAGLPPDFFDNSVKPSTSEDPPEEAEDNSTMAEKLPEGFFDDPKKDAKVRKVEYKDKMDEEWELFQKALTQETTISMAIVEEDDEANQAERNIEEIDHMMARWSNVDQLEKRKESMKSAEKAQISESSDSDMDESEYNDLLDWRVKKV